jgi:hypothetical protein
VREASRPSLALGLCSHTGWAAAVVAGGGWSAPVLAAREHVELLGQDERFLFHKAAEMPPAQARAWVARARAKAAERATAVMRRLASAHPVEACALVAKKGTLLPLEDIVAAHPRIHTAEGLFYRDVLEEAAKAAGLRVKVIPPATLDAKDPRLVNVGRVVGKPWSVDWKLAVMGAWAVGSL